MERRGTQPLERELWMPAPVSRVPMDALESRYGDPERAMLEAEAPTPAPPIRLPASPYVIEAQEVLKNLIALDRVILQLWLSGRSQDEIGELTGITQPSVSGRISRIKSWVELVVPVRLYAKGYALPPWISTDRRRIWDLIVWRHLSQTDVSKIIGRTQGMVRHAFQWTVGHEGLVGPVAEIGEFVMENTTQWCRPRISGLGQIPEWLRDGELEEFKPR